MSGNTSPDKTCTLEEFVASGVNDDMTYINFSVIDKIKDMEIVDHCLIDDYLPELQSLCMEIVGLTTADRVKYRYAPDFLAYDMYGSTQLDFIVMLVNGVATPEEFTMRGKLYLPKNSVLKAFLSEVYNAEANYLQINRSEFSTT